MSNYNKKLFSGGLRKRLHIMRFKWLHQRLQEPEDSYSLFELGCFDCRSLQYIPRPKRYLGADAGWEGGINDAQMTYVNVPWAKLVVALTARDLEPFQDQRFDYSVALETLEHIPEALLDGYLKFLARVTTKQLLITVPVEIGAVFLLKYLAKRLFSNLEGGDTHTYTLAEVYWATLGRVDRVRRFEHKGFDYRIFIEQLRQYFDIVRVDGLPFTRFPTLSFQVAILAEPKKGVRA